MGDENGWCISLYGDCVYELLSLEQVVGHKTTAADSASSLFSHLCMLLCVGWLVEFIPFFI